MGEERGGFGADSAQIQWTFLEPPSQAGREATQTWNGGRGLAPITRSAVAAYHNERHIAAQARQVPSGV
jgi:hypothetical protein